MSYRHTVIGTIGSGRDFKIADEETLERIAELGEDHPRHHRRPRHRDPGHAPPRRPPDALAGLDAGGPRRRALRDQHGQGPREGSPHAPRPRRRHRDRRPGQRVPLADDLRPGGREDRGVGPGARAPGHRASTSWPGSTWTGTRTPSARRGRRGCSTTSVPTRSSRSARRDRVVPSSGPFPHRKAVPWRPASALP